MTQYWYVFGTDEFHSNNTNSDTLLSYYASYLSDNPADQYDDEMGTATTADYVTESSHSVDTSGPDISTRLDNAHDDISNNYQYHSLLSVCVIIDEFSTFSGVLGEAESLGGVNDNGDKCCIINKHTVDDASSFGVSVQEAAAHEVGHIIGCLHPHVSFDNYIEDGILKKEATLMHTGSSISNTCDGTDDDDVDRLQDSYSSCAENNFVT